MSKFPSFFSKNRLLLLAIVLLLILVAATLSGLPLGSLLRTQVSTRQPNTRHASAAEIAQAMQEDHFFSDYASSALIVEGTVARVFVQNNHHILEMATPIDTKVECDFGSLTLNVKPGDSISFVSPNASQAQRVPGAILLANCQLP